MVILTKDCFLMGKGSDKATLTPVLFHSVYPVPKNNRGQAFSHLSDMLAHLEGEATGHWLIGSNGMWHPGIHITDATTPWCALSGKAVQEAIQYPVPYKGEQAIRCMADGEVVAYRINRDYLAMPWITGDLAYSTTFVLVRHRIQPGQTAASALKFYTLYMHLAPWSAYPEENPAYKVADGQHLKAYVDDSLMWTATTLKPGTRVKWNTADPAARMSAHGRQYARVSLVEGITDKMSLNVGDRLWVVCDNGNLVQDGGPVRPAWWANLLPPAKETMQFDTVVCPTPYPIKAGEAIGHLGYYQAPTDGGSAGRYQVHIECFTADELPHFLTNPEGAGRDTPTFASYPNGAPRYLKSMSRDGAISAPQIDLTTNQTGIFALADSHRVVSDGVAYWQNGGEGWYLAESDLTMLSRYDLTARGFESTEANPTSFDHLDGVNQPQGLVRYIYQKLFDISSKDPRTSHALVRYNYQRLLDNIDRGEKHYSTQEYRLAVQNQSYLEHLQRLCVKHPADWYYAAEDPIWQTFFTPLFKKESPLWYRYSINFLTATRWMHLVPEMVAEPWYMHPIVFLDAIKCDGYDFSTRAGTIRAIIEESRKQGFRLNSQVAYILATVKRETGDMFQPVREGDWAGHTSTDEYRKKHYRYYPYYGRGYVQITWDYNYKIYSDKLGVDLVSEPDRALEPNNSLFILIDGFKNGVFTGKKLTDYISKDRMDFLNARQCINGLDHAEQIKGFAEDFLSKLDAGALI
jgi:hypothetical protein